MMVENREITLLNLREEGDGSGGMDGTWITVNDTVMLLKVRLIFHVINPMPHWSANEATMDQSAS